MKTSGSRLAKFPTAVKVGVPMPPINSENQLPIPRQKSISCSCASAGSLLNSPSRLVPICMNSASIFCHMTGSSLTKLTVSRTSLTPMPYTSRMTAAITAIITNAETAFRRIFSFSSKNLTSGDAISEIIQPIINGMKKPIHLGSRKIHKSNMTSAVNIFRIDFT